MWFFAHVGFTVGLAAALDAAGRRAVSPAAVETASGSAAGATAGRTAGAARRSVLLERARPWLLLSQTIDYRLVAVGSVLPDLDKPISLEIFHSFDRGLLHTLLFTLLLLAAGVYLFRRAGSTMGLQLGCCWVAHLVLDQMWLRPRVLLWPLYGWNPEGGTLSLRQFAVFMDRTLTTDPSAYLPEMVGFVVVAAVVGYLARRGELGTLVRTGRVGAARRGGGAEDEPSPRGHALWHVHASPLGRDRESNGGG